MWTAIEVNTGILCASIPMIKPLVARLLPGWIGVAQPSTTSSEQPATGGQGANHEQFFNLRGPRSALSLTLRESVKPVGIVTALFFMWGFAYGFIDTLNKRMESFIGISTEQYIGLHAAYFGCVFWFFLGRVISRASRMGRVLLKK